MNIQWLRRQLGYVTHKYTLFNGDTEKKFFYDKSIKPIEEIIDFIEQAYEIAYGDNAINKNYSAEEVLQKLQDFSDDALTYEEKYKYAKN
jgi:ABC-type bacteriocin/lantibiotic exporter with double-glycine peptidase domain